MKDPIDKARLLNQAYETLCKRGEGWTLDMLADMKKLVLEAEEKEVQYIMEQDYLLEEEAKINSSITESGMQDMADYYEDKAKGIKR
tara:strand:+ start:743 stop:1003 length:261 start_codon:yes stop_codon:yes gene_type:complete